MLEAAAIGTSLAIGTVVWGIYAPNSTLFGPVIGRGPDRPILFLTFDDGPNPGVTEAVLEVLEREQVPATFFMVGKHVQLHARTACAVAETGHEIGNHTFSHLKLHRAGPRRVGEEIRWAHQTITGVTGYVPTSFRAPHGYRGPFVARATAPYRYRSFGWTFGVWDSARPGAERIRARVRRRLRPGSIVLLHDGDGYNPAGDRWQTAEALPGIIKDARDAGYVFQPLSSLVAD